MDKCLISDGQLNLSAVLHDGVEQEQNDYEFQSRIYRKTLLTSNRSEIHYPLVLLNKSIAVL